MERKKRKKKKKKKEERKKIRRKKAYFLQTLQACTEQIALHEAEGSSLLHTLQQLLNLFLCVHYPGSKVQSLYPNYKKIKEIMVGVSKTEMTEV